VHRAVAATHHIGTSDCQRFRKRVFNAHIGLAPVLARNYLSIVEEKNLHEANANLKRIDERLQIHDLNLSWPDRELKQFAKEKANICIQIAASAPDYETALCHLKEFVICYAIDVPKPENHQGLISACINRIQSKKWWIDQLRLKQRRTIESVARELGIVSKHKSIYASRHAIDRRSEQCSRNNSYLESTQIINEDGELFSLKELSDKSVSNPEVRRAELMVRIHGFQTVADRLGHVAEFYTLTTPSRMHAFHAKSGKPNPKFDGTSVLAAQKHLCHVWGLVRSKLNREGIQPYGFRVAEPHQDGTPHWHFLLFMPENQRSRTRKIFRHYALQEDGHEKGARKHRLKIVKIDKSKGSAAGYIAKYISKNIDGYGLDQDLNGNDAKRSAIAIDTWKATWGIRQFQQIGGPSVSVWRELRRLYSSQGKMEFARQAADAADWAAFTMTMGGPTMRRAERPIHLEYMPQATCCPETGEISNGHVGLYGEPKKDKLIGLRAGPIFECTRWRKWEIQQYSAPPAARQEGGYPPPCRAEGALDLCQ